MLINRTNIAKLAGKSKTWVNVSIENDPNFPKHKTSIKCKGGYCHLYCQDEIQSYITAHEQKLRARPAPKPKVKPIAQSKAEQFNQKACSFLSKALTLDEQEQQHSKLIQAKNHPPLTQRIRIKSVIEENDAPSKRNHTQHLGISNKRHDRARNLHQHGAY